LGKKGENTLYACFRGKTLIGFILSGCTISSAAFHNKKDKDKERQSIYFRKNSYRRRKIILKALSQVLIYGV